jgi:hypothetical protein
MDFTYNERRYIAENNQFKIEPINSIIPESFTKYYSLSKFSIDALLKNYIYASHPYELNDPFDCFRELIDFSEMKEKIRKDFYGTNLPIDDTQIYNGLFESIGIISMTSSENENPILWAYYSNKHSGFSATYNKDAFTNKSIKGPFPVDYIKKLKKIKVTKQDVMAQIFCHTMIKSNKWLSEDEWRFLYVNKDMYIPGLDYRNIKIRNQENRKFYLPKKSIKEIKLGFYFFDAINNVSINNLGEFIVDLSRETDSEYKKKLINFASTNNIPLKMMYLNKEKFSFSAESIDYEYINYATF